jgi:hypothetical protein
MIIVINAKIIKTISVSKALQITFKYFLMLTAHLPNFRPLSIIADVVPQLKIRLSTPLNDSPTRHHGA